MPSTSLRVLLLLTACVALHIGSSSATISCYECVGTNQSPNDDCVSITSALTTTTSKPSTGNSSSVVVISDVITQSGCTSCVTVKATVGSIATYTRTCSAASSVATGCVSVASVSTCTYSCDTNLCNTGDAHSLRYTLASLLGALIMSATGTLAL